MCLTLLQERLTDDLNSNVHTTFGLDVCEVEISAPYASGSYAMAAVRLDDCLQKLSDGVVNSTYTEAEPDQPPPAWVMSLPEVRITGITCLRSSLYCARFGLRSRPDPLATLLVAKPERSEKLAMLAKYGSPNVFTQFAPHVTLGWAKNTSLVASAVARLKREGILAQPVRFKAEVVADGKTGDHGTVLKGNDTGV